jgi:hypothetical protein
LERIREKAEGEGEAEREAVAALRAAEVSEVERWRVEEIGKGLEESSDEWGP